MRLYRLHLGVAQRRAGYSGRAALAMCLHQAGVQLSEPVVEDVGLEQLEQDTVLARGAELRKDLAVPG